MKGQKPPWVHELDTRLNLIEKFDADLYLPYIELCEKATRYYIEDRYPPGPPAEYDRSEIQIDLELSWQLIRVLKERAGLQEGSPSPHK